MTKEKTLDLIIIGAGPAGISTALHLIQLDSSWRDRMLILEKASHPRHKLCGGGITRIGLNTLIDLSIPFPLAIPHAVIDHVILKYKEQVINVHGKPMFIVVSRSEFDQYLAEKAVDRGIRLLENEEVKAITNGNNHVIVKTGENEYLTKVVVGADGSLGITRKLYGYLTNEKRTSRTLEVISKIGKISPHFTDQSAFFDFTNLSINLQGYYWEFPLFLGGKPFINRGVYDSRRDKSKDKAKLLNILDRKIGGTGKPSEIDKFESAPINLFDPRNKLSTDRVILVGDAAGVDSLFGEGIGPALKYGKIAANQVKKAVEKNNFRFSRYRFKILSSRIGRYLVLRWLLAGYLYHLGDIPFFSKLLWVLGKILARIWRPGKLY